VFSPGVKKGQYGGQILCPEENYCCTGGRTSLSRVVRFENEGTRKRERKVGNHVFITATTDDSTTDEWSEMDEN